MELSVFVLVMISLAGTFFYFHGKAPLNQPMMLTCLYYILMKILRKSIPVNDCFFHACLAPVECLSGLLAEQFNRAGSSRNAARKKATSNE
jgi:hypothetical protein